MKTEEKDRLENISNTFRALCNGTAKGYIICVEAKVKKNKTHAEVVYDRDVTLRDMSEGMLVDSLMDILGDFEFAYDKQKHENKQKKNTETA